MIRGGVSELLGVLSVVAAGWSLFEVTWICGDEILGIGFVQDFDGTLRSQSPLGETDQGVRDVA